MSSTTERTGGALSVFLRGFRQAASPLADVLQRRLSISQECRFCDADVKPLRIRLTECWQAVLLLRWYECEHCFETSLRFDRERFGSRKRRTSKRPQPEVCEAGSPDEEDRSLQVPAADPSVDTVQAYVDRNRQMFRRDIPSQYTARLHGLPTKRMRQRAARR